MDVEDGVETSDSVDPSEVVVHRDKQPHRGKMSKRVLPTFFGPRAAGTKYHDNASSGRQNMDAICP